MQELRKTGEDLKKQASEFDLQSAVPSASTNDKTDSPAEKDST